MKWIWVPFWKSVDTEEKRAYAHKWNVTDYWEELLLGDWLLLGDPEEERKHEEWLQLLNAQDEALRLGKEVEPPGSYTRAQNHWIILLEASWRHGSIASGCPSGNASHKTNAELMSKSEMPLLLGVICC
ncbi:MAG: hypothetical protein JWL77_1978 [Chthonomonadaceae bacterium]|nr:hypothetical protein [Chthonomonadaceae bacterium]